MRFSSANAIYLQIAESIFDKILLSEWTEGERIPSVREFAVSIEVNPNTVMRTYTHLQDLKIIFNKRGIGFFVSDGAQGRIKKILRKQFFEKNLPEFFKAIDLLDINLDSLAEEYQAYLKANAGEKNETD